MNSASSFFFQRPKSATHAVLNVVKSLVRRAKEEMGQIDGVVLPELSMSENDHEQEDLARPDPVGDLVRSVGPNLVIALLMDGPQLRARWSGRYAMSLADDPGSFVLSVTSLGTTEELVSQRSREYGVSRVDALSL
jgi:hypothetical protein